MNAGLVMFNRCLEGYRQMTVSRLFLMTQGSGRRNVRAVLFLHPVNAHVSWN